MKQAIALIAILATFAMGACSYKSGSKLVYLATCKPGDTGVKVYLQENSYTPSARVVRLAAH